MVRAYWLGGPADGSFLLIEEAQLNTHFRVLSGSKRNPEERYVTPRRTKDRGWILPFYEGRITTEDDPATKETR